MPKESSCDRRGFLCAAAVGVAAGTISMRELAQSDSAISMSAPRAQTAPGQAKSFAPLKQIDAGLLNVGYVDVGPATGQAVVLLHGWPYDIHSFADVAPILASKGYRVIIPYLRGYGSTQFLSSETLRNGQPAALASDLITLLDALKIEKAILAGFDWGARTGDIVAALWPERCKALVSVSGYLIGNQEAGKVPLPPNDRRRHWAQLAARSTASLRQSRRRRRSLCSSMSAPRDT